jgi:hypothetical protein
MPHTFLPDDISTTHATRLAALSIDEKAIRAGQLSEHDQQKASARLAAKMRLFYATIRASDFADMGPRGNKPVYRGKPMSRNSTRKGGRPPAVFGAVEELVDFKRAMEADDLQTAKRLYFYLVRLLGW